MPWHGTATASLKFKLIDVLLFFVHTSDTTAEFIRPSESAKKGQMALEVREECESFLNDAQAPSLGLFTRRLILHHLCHFFSIFIYVHELFMMLLIL